ncbi:unnamed protein product [Blepharisma stoltei]|uniref:Uncharacterized protein n=1 Tax=Blepharisma stoltei TaxID=1481888 RepID=A0AAU9IWR1_9CILI|nr:unnamed protein product [Blepharisma stoltei]
MQTHKKAALSIASPHSLILPIPYIYSLPDSQQIQDFISSDFFSLILTHQGKVWILGNPTDSNDNPDIDDIYKEITIPRQITSISCNSEASLLLSIYHEVYGLGNDSLRSGIFINFDRASMPRLIEGLTANGLNQISLGSGHAAGIDEQGLVYTWGSGKFGELGGINLIEERALPLVIDKARNFSVIKIICGDSFTCMCTSGGYVYILGVIGSHHQSSKKSEAFLRSSQKSMQSPRGVLSPNREIKNAPYTLPELEQHFVVDISAGNEFIAVLSEEGAVYAFDDCMELYRLPSEENSKVKTIAACHRSIFGLTSEQCLYEWTEPVMEYSANNMLNTLIIAGKSICSISAWPGSQYKLDPAYIKPNFASNQKRGIAFIFESKINFKPVGLGELIGTYDPYKRDLFTHQLVHSVFESLDAPLLSTPPYIGSPKRFVTASQESLYPADFEMDKVIRYRLEHERGEQINKSLAPLISPLFKEIFGRIKIYSEKNQALNKAIKYASLPNILLRVFTKERNRKLILGFTSVRNFWYTKIIADKKRRENKQQEFMDNGVKLVAKIIKKILKKRLYKAETDFIETLKTCAVKEKYKENLLETIFKNSEKWHYWILKEKWSKWIRKTSSNKVFQSAEYDIAKYLKTIILKRYFRNLKGEIDKYKLKGNANKKLEIILKKKYSKLIRIAISKWKENRLKYIKPKLKNQNILIKNTGNASISRQSLLCFTAIVQKIISKRKYQAFNCVSRYSCDYKDKYSKLQIADPDLTENTTFSSKFAFGSPKMVLSPPSFSKDESYEFLRMEDFSKFSSSKYKETDNDFSIFSINSDEKGQNNMTLKSSSFSAIDKEIYKEKGENSDQSNENIIVINQPYQREIIPKLPLRIITSPHAKRNSENLSSPKPKAQTTRSSSNIPSREPRSIVKLTPKSSSRSGSSSSMKSEQASSAALRQQYDFNLKERLKRIRQTSNSKPIRSNTYDEEQLVNKCTKVLGNLKTETHAKPPRPKKLEIKLKSNDTTKPVSKHNTSFEDISMRFSLGLSALQRVTEKTSFILKYFSFITMKDYKPSKAIKIPINLQTQKGYIESISSDDKKLENIWHLKLYSIGFQRSVKFYNRYLLKRYWEIFKKT